MDINFFRANVKIRNNYDIFEHYILQSTLWKSEFLEENEGY